MDEAEKNPLFADAGIKPATQTGLFGPQIGALLRTFSYFSNQKITCKALKRLFALMRYNKAF